MVDSDDWVGGWVGLVGGWVCGGGGGGKLFLVVDDLASPYHIAMLRILAAMYRSTFTCHARFPHIFVTNNARFPYLHPHTPTHPASHQLTNPPLPATPPRPPTHTAIRPPTHIHTPAHPSTQNCHTRNFFTHLCAQPNHYVCLCLSMSPWACQSVRLAVRVHMFVC